MTALVVILFILMCFTAWEFPRFFLRKYRRFTVSELRDTEKGAISRAYPWSQVIYAIISGLALLICGVLLWTYLGGKVYALAGAWVAQLGIFDGCFAAKTGIYPIPQRIGYFYVVENDEYTCRLSKIHIGVGVIVASAIIVWVILS
jgi:hypothetical protein